MNRLRVVAVSTALMATAAFSAAGSAGADPPPTQVITAVVVGPSGQPINGYREAPEERITVEGCEPSPSAVAANVYSCSPSAAGAGTCWPSTPGSLLCMDDPWDKRLHRVRYNGQLPPVQPTETPDPFALVLDDGSRCLLRNGGSWGGRADGYVGGYCAVVAARTPRCCARPTRRPGPASTARRRCGRSKSANSAHLMPSFRRPRPTR